MKRPMTHIAMLLLAFTPWAQAAQSHAMPAKANDLPRDCSEISDSRVVNPSTSLHVALVSCPNGMHVVVDRKVDGASVETASREFTIPYATANGVTALDKDTFQVNLLEVRYFANPSARAYRFHFQNNQWVLQELSFQATQSCHGEAGLDADAYDVDLLSGKVELTRYSGCEHFTKKQLTIEPATISLEKFDPAEDRLAPFRYE